MTFSGTNVLVTGGSRGIGRAVVEAFAAAGARVGLTYRSAEAVAREALAALPGEGHRAFRADFAARATADRLAAEAWEAFGRVHVLVNNAGVFVEHPPATCEPDAWRRAWDETLAVNLLAPADLSLALARRMMAAGGGKIVNVSSRGAFRGEPDAPAYGASKAGLNALSQSLAKALAPHGVFVYAVAPGWVDTDMAAGYGDDDAVKAQSPLHRIARPEEIARAVLYFAGPDTDFATGAILDVNGASYLRT